jgi:hypothetical protein
MLDDAEEVGPEVAGVVEAVTLSGAAERLARGGASPYWGVVRHSGEAQGAGPSCNPSKPVTLEKSSNVICVHLDDASFINNPIGNMTAID